MTARLEHGGRYLRPCPACGCIGLCELALICIDCGAEFTDAGRADFTANPRRYVSAKPLQPQAAGPSR